MICVILQVIPDTAKLFREGKSELHRLLGSQYLVYNPQKDLLPDIINGLITTQTYKTFQRKHLSTIDDVSFLSAGYFIAHIKEPDNRMEVYGKDNHYIQDQLISSVIYLSISDDPINRLALST